MLMTEVRKIPEILRRQKTRRRRRTIPEMSRAGMEWWKKKRERTDELISLCVEVAMNTSWHVIDDSLQVRKRAIDQR